MDTKQDFFQKKLSNTRSFTRQRSTSKIRLVIVLLAFLIGAGGFLFRKMFGAPVNLDNVEIDREKVSLGQELYLEGDLKANGDLITHTHTISDATYGIVGLKSSEINLSEYLGYVQLTGSVEKNGSMVIVRVLELSGSLAVDDEEVDIVNDEKSGVYIMSAGIQFLPSFFEEYVLLNEGENGEILIQNIESGEEIAINYFRCKDSDPNRNCKGLSETFANSSAQSFVTSEGDVYYKQSEVQSWFVANGNRWGIFLNDVSDDVVYQLKDLMKFANEKNINEWMKSRAMKICQGDGEKMQEIVEHNIELKQDGLIAIVKGKGKEKMMTCQILVDFSLPNKGTLQKLEIGDVIEVEEIDNEDEKNSNSENEKNEEQGQLNIEENKVEVSSKEWNPNVEQFPIKSEGGLVYTSSRGGYSLQFPSSNISYNVSAVKESFNQNDLSCTYVINVIKYSDKENLEISPALRIYECNSKDVVKSWDVNYVTYNVIGKIFVVEINDSSWIDFSKNLNFTSLN